MSVILKGTSQLLPKFNKFSEFIITNKAQISPKIFSREFGYIQKDFIDAKQRELFCKEADKLAINLMKEEKGDFAGIIYSALTKLTEYIPRELEIYAKRGLEVARSNGDYVHIMARLNNLRKVYMDKPEKVYDYVQTLYAQEKCLKKLASQFEKTSETYKTVTRKPASKENYEKMLAFVQTEIGKLTWRKHPNDSMKKLLNAKEIFEKNKDSKSLSYVEMLMNKIKTHPRFEDMA